MNDTTRNIGSVLGVAVLGSVTASVFAARMAAAHPCGHPVAAHLTGAAISSIGAVAATAHRLPAAVAAPLMHTADGAFVAGADRAALAGAIATALAPWPLPGAAFALNRLANRTAPVSAGAVSCVCARNVILTMRLRIPEAARRAPPGGTIVTSRVHLNTRAFGTDVTAGKTWGHHGGSGTSAGRG